MKIKRTITTVVETSPGEPHNPADHAATILCYGALEVVIRWPQDIEDGVEETFSPLEERR